MSTTAWMDRVPFLRALTPEARAALLSHARVRTLEPGESIWREGEPTDYVVFLLRGHLKLLMAAENGKNTIVELIEPGDLACSSAVFAQSPYCCSAEPVSTGAQVLEIPKVVLHRMCEQDMAVVKALWQCQGCRGMATCHRVTELAHGRVEQRVAALLLKLAERHPETDASGHSRISVILTRQEIAELCGTTLETAIRVMSRFRKQGMVEASARGFVINDPESLRAIVEGPDRPRAQNRPSKSRAARA